MIARASPDRVLAWSIALLIGTSSLSIPRIAFAQYLQPGTPVFEAVGHGVVRPWFEMGWYPIAAAKREADAGGGAEFTTVSSVGQLVERVERWKMSADGVPYFAGYIPTTHRVTAMTWADMNGDGSADLLCAETNGAVIEVFSMGPSGPVAPGQMLTFDPYETPNYISYLTVADVNTDGYPDVGVVGASPGDDFGLLRWLMSQGSSSFATMQSCVAAQPVVAQLGPDAIADLVNWSPQSLLISIARGPISGVFPLVHDPPLEASGKPFVSDLDHDGVPDIVAGRFLYRGVAGGPPTKQDSLAANASAMLDLDHDGIADLVAVESGKIRVARGLGGFAFAPFTEDAAGWIDDHHARGPFGMSAVMDVDGDGWVDVLGSAGRAGFDGQGNYRTRSRVMYAIPGKPGGRFHQLLRVPTGSGTTQIALADILGADGRPDLVVLARGARRLEVRPGAGDGTFGPAQHHALPAGARRFTLADLNEDGRLDAAVACDTSSTLRVFAGTATGWDPAIDLPAPDSLSDVVVGDIDEDGSLDLLASTTAGELVGWKGNGAMGLASVAWSAGTWRGDGRLRLADVDGDGHLDVVAHNYRSAVGPWYVDVRLGDGSGQFPWYGPSMGGVGPGSAFETADLLGDGRTFVAYATMDSASSHHSFFRAFTLQGGVKTPLPWHCESMGPCSDQNEGHEVAPTPRQLAIADVTGDEVPDALVLSASGSVLTVIPGLGGGQFGTPIAHIAGSDPSSFALGDVDGDGDLDAMVADLATDEVMLMRNLGGATTGVAPTTPNASLRLFVDSTPNAAQLRLRLRLPSAGAARVEVFDLLGRRLAEVTLDAAAPGEEAVTIDGGRLHGNGVYFARLSQGSARASTRLMRFN